MGFTKENAKQLGSMGGHASKRKLLAWDSLGEYLIAEGAPAVVEIMKTLKTEGETKEFIAHFKDILEYFKPKRAREDGKGNADTGTKIFIGDESRAGAKDALDEFID